MTILTKIWALVRFLLVTEWRMYVGAARFLTRRPDIPADATPVRYAGAVSALLWGITAVSAVELVALHLILPWHTVRLAADILGIWGVVWCLGMTGCHYVYPHLVTPSALRLRNAHPGDVVTVPWSTVATARVRERSTESGRSLQVGDGLVQVVIGQRTNVELTLTTPLSVTVKGVTHEVHEVRVYVDDPRALVSAVRSRVGSGASEPS